MPNFVATGQTIAETCRFIFFSIWRPSTIFDLLCACLDHPLRAFGGFYGCAKFGWNWCCSFDNIHSFRFCLFGLKMPIHAPKLAFLGIWPPNWAGISTKPQKAHPWGKDVVWHIYHQNRSTAATCACDLETKKGRQRKKPDEQCENGYSLKPPMKFCMVGGVQG